MRPKSRGTPLPGTTAAPLRARVVVSLAALAAAAPSPLPSQIAPVTLTPVAAIGCVTCDGPEAFGSITAVAVGAGRVVVADRDAPHLRIFDTGGVFLRSVGADGDGPGELRFPLAVSVVDEGISAVDMRQVRVVRVDHEGRERGTLRLESFPLAVSFAPGSEAMDVSLADFRAMEASIVRRDGGGWRTLRDRVEGLGLSRPGEPPLLFSLARAPDDGFVVGLGMDDYRLLFFDPTGKDVRRVIRDVPRTARTAEEIEEQRRIRERALARLGGIEGGGRPPEMEIDPLRLHFGLDALRFDGQGRLWVRTDRGRGATLFDLFDASGRYLGEVPVPGRVGPFAVGDGLLAAVVLDDMDLPTVRVFRVTGSPAPPSRGWITPQVEPPAARR